MQNFHGVGSWILAVIGYLPETNHRNWHLHEESQKRIWTTYVWELTADALYFLQVTISKKENLNLKNK